MSVQAHVGCSVCVMWEEKDLQWLMCEARGMRSSEEEDDDMLVSVGGWLP